MYETLFIVTVVPRVTAGVIAAIVAAEHVKAGEVPDISKSARYSLSNMPGTDVLSIVAVSASSDVLSMAVMSASGIVGIFYSAKKSRYCGLFFLNYVYLFDNYPGIRLFTECFVE